DPGEHRQREVGAEQTGGGRARDGGRAGGEEEPAFPERLGVRGEEQPADPRFGAQGVSGVPRLLGLQLGGGDRRARGEGVGQRGPGAGEGQDQRHREAGAEREPGPKEPEAEGEQVDDETAVLGAPGLEDGRLDRLGETRDPGDCRRRGGGSGRREGRVPAELSRLVRESRGPGRPEREGKDAPEQTQPPRVQSQGLSPETGGGAHGGGGGGGDRERQDHPADPVPA
ncbi:hypothetical protein HWI79_3141, partial [Cryptosporidium felis]